LPDGIVIDGELLPWDFSANRPLPFSALQKRIGRKTVGKKLLAEIPVILMAYDLLERDGADIRTQAFFDRRKQLEDVISQLSESAQIRLSPQVAFDNWPSLVQTRLASREGMVEGLMLKRLDSPYRVGRKRGDWWKWKIEPMTMDCVLTMAQRGSGRRASLYTDYTFAVWDRPGGSLVPVAKAYSGLTDEEIAIVDAFVRKNTTDKFGPVRAVKPEMVMEIAFEAIGRSSRHKSGLAVRFPRIARIRHDKKLEEADTLDSLERLLAQYGSAAAMAGEES
jgi:DNA ligase-1